jgi:peptide-methionine (S)-S-oxide reductase
MSSSTERAVLTGGCFWNTQDLLRRYPGVISTRVGYTGGEAPNATYRNHGNHAETLEVIPEQKGIAEEAIADVGASEIWPGKVVTEITPAGPFWEAEPEHQDYLEKYPNGYTCHFIRPNWTLPKKAVLKEVTETNSD